MFTRKLLYLVHQNNLLCACTGVLDSNPFPQRGKINRITNSGGMQWRYIPYNQNDTYLMGSQNTLFNFVMRFRVIVSGSSGERNWIGKHKRVYREQSANPEALLPVCPLTYNNPARPRREHLQQRTCRQALYQACLPPSSAQEKRARGRSICGSAGLERFWSGF